MRNTLKEKEKKLYNRLEEIQGLAESVLTYTTSKFPYYTPHDFKHSLNVEENLNWLIPDECKIDFTDYEIFFLIISAWLHDWGMVGSNDEDPKEIRENHHIRTEEFFEKMHDKVRLSLNEGRIIGKICLGHRKENLLDSKYEDMYFGSNIRIRPRFLSALLRIADECDVTQNRVPEIIYYSLNPKGASKIEFDKHLNVIGIGQPEPYKLQLSGVARDPKGVKVLEGVTKKIQNELNQVKSILAQEKIMLEYVESKIDTRGFINKPIEFEIDRKKIVDLLIGKSLYKRKDSGIRELLQNSIDACRIRNSMEKNYSPLIEFSFNDKIISISDNGIGMNFDIASKYLSNIGTSFFVSKEFEKMMHGKKAFDAISRFGIGILSCFIIASKVIIETKKENNDPCRFVIDKLDEGWRYESSSTKTVGTKISLSLNELGTKIDLEKALLHYAKDVEFPIKIINEITGEQKFFEPLWDITMDELTKSSHLSRNYRDKELPKPDFIGSVKTDGIKADYYYYAVPSPFYDSIHFVSYHGIYLNQFILCNAFSDNLVVLVNCNKNLFDVNVSRDDIIDNDKKNQFTKLLYDNYLILVNKLFAERTKNKELSEFDQCIEFANTCRMLFGEGKSTCTIVYPSDYAALLTFFSNTVCPVLDSEGLQLLTWNQLFEKDLNKIYLYRICSKGYRLLDCQYHIDVVKELWEKTLKEKEIVVFDMSPNLIIGEKPYINELKHPFVLFAEQKNHKVQQVDINGLLALTKFKRTQTDLDQLLPGDSYLSVLPKKFRSFMITKKDYPFSVKKFKNYRIYRILVMRELLERDFHLLEFLNKTLKENPDINIQNTEFFTKKVKFIFDLNDDIIRILLANVGVIFGKELIRVTVELYFRLLILAHKELDDIEIQAYLVIIEKTLLRMLDYKGKYQSLPNRIGRLMKNEIESKIPNQ